MANIYPNNINPKSKPIEYAVETGLTRARLNIGVSGEEDSIFSGIVYKRNGGTYIGTDLQPYVKHLVDTSPRFEQLFNDLIEDTNWSYEFDAVFKNVNTGTAIDFSTLGRLVTAQRLNHYEYERYLEKEPFGLYSLYPTPSPLKFADQHDDVILNNFWSFHNEDVFTMRDIPYNLTLRGAPLWINIANTGTNTRTYDFRQIQWKENKTTQVVATATISQSFLTGDACTYYGNRDFLDEDPKYVQMFIGNSGWEADWRHCIFEYVEPCESSVQLYWENRRGGIDFYPMKGRVIEQKSINKDRYRINERTLTNSGFVGDTSKQINPIFSIESIRQFKINSGYVSEEKSKYLFDSIVDSPKVWLWVHSEQKAYSVSIKDSIYEYKNFSKDKMFTHSFIVEQQHQENE